MGTSFLIIDGHGSETVEEEYKRYMIRMYNGITITDTTPKKMATYIMITVVHVHSSQLKNITQ